MYTVIYVTYVCKYLMVMKFDGGLFLNLFKGASHLLLLLVTVYLCIYDAESVSKFVYLPISKLVQKIVR